MDSPRQEFVEDQYTPPKRKPRRMRRQVRVLGLLIIVAGLVWSARDIIVPIPNLRLPDIFDNLADQQPGLYPVVRVSDGDTITVRIDGREESIRMLGVDTPETKDPRKPVQCFGEAASRHTKARLSGRRVRLEPDPTNSDRDKYDRLLRYVYLPDGTLYNAELIRDGYAFAYTVFPLIRADEFRQLEREARVANRGLWAGCAVDDGDAVKQTTTGK